MTEQEHYVTAMAAFNEAYNLVLACRCGATFQDRPSVAQAQFRFHLAQVEA